MPLSIRAAADEGGALLRLGLVRTPEALPIEYHFGSLQSTSMDASALVLTPNPFNRLTDALPSGLPVAETSA